MGLEGGDGGLLGQPGGLHHHPTAAPLPHYCEGSHTDGVGLVSCQSTYQVLQLGIEHLKINDFEWMLEQLQNSISCLNFISYRLASHHGAEVDSISCDVSCRGQGGQPGDQDGVGGDRNCLDVLGRGGHILHGSAVHWSALYALTNSGLCCHLHCVVLIFLQLLDSYQSVQSMKPCALSH